MTIIRKIGIRNFRSIKELIWFPSPGINCLIGHGDIGKSTILDAIDACLTTRRTLHFTDMDFNNLNVAQPIEISVIIGDLPDECRNFEKYGNYLRGFDLKTLTLHEEPLKDADTVLSLRLTVSDDLEPSWALLSHRGEETGVVRSLSWADRILLAPLRIGTLNNYHMGWQRGSILNRLSDERPDTAPLLVELSREARRTVGNQGDELLGDALKTITETAKELGIPIGDSATAMLDIGAVTFGESVLSLHDSNRIPMRSLGTGSSRLLLAGLHRKAIQHSTILLIDELEYGLEPHRIFCLLKSLGAKEAMPEKQVFMTTHSPVVVRELSASQLCIIRKNGQKHIIQAPEGGGSIQGTLRKYPEAFLAPNVIICEGASEVGFIRGLDEYRCSHDASYNSLTAKGIALIDGTGGTVQQLYARAREFSSLGYRVLVFRDDDDKKPPAKEEDELKSLNIKVVKWRDGNALENEIFSNVPDDAIAKILEYAAELYGFDIIREHVKSASDGHFDLQRLSSPPRFDGAQRDYLGIAAKRGYKWFKNQTKMERVAMIIGPYITASEEPFRDVIADIFDWIA